MLVKAVLLTPVVFMVHDTGTRYKLLILSMDGATLDEISVTVNQQQLPLALSCFIVTSHNEVTTTFHSFYIQQFGSCCPLSCYTV